MQRLIVFHRGKEYGPFPPWELRRLATSGKLPPEALIRDVDSRRWTRAENVGGLTFPPSNPRKPPPPHISRESSAA